MNKSDKQFYTLKRTKLLKLLERIEYLMEGEEKPTLRVDEIYVEADKLVGEILREDKR